VNRLVYSEEENYTELLIVSGQGENTERRGQGENKDSKMALQRVLYLYILATEPKEG
jgi:hypothetical protein